MKTKTLSLTLLVLSVLLLFASCAKEESSDVNQNKIYSEYELFYDKANDKTYASAIFKFSNSAGTQLKLTKPSEIRFNGDTIPYDPLFSYYRKEYAGKIDAGTFMFKDSDGKTYSNPANLAKVITNPVIDTLRRTGAYTYTWIGDALANNELIGLTIGNNANAFNFQVFLQNAVGSSNIVLPLTQLNQLPIGLSYCQLDRQIEVVTGSFTSAGGKVRGKYRAPNTNLYVK